MQSLLKYQCHFSKKEQIILKLLWEHKGPWIAKTTLRKKGNAGGIIHPDFKLYYTAMVKKERKKNQYGTGMKTPSLKEQNKEPRNNDSDRLSPQFNWCQRRQ